MAKQAVSEIRKSSALIILAKEKVLPGKQPDFKAVLFNRPAQASFMPNSAVFPGGVFEAADETPLWKKHFENMGVSKQKLQSLCLGKAARPDIYRQDSPEAMERQLSLRITALRETFEELGLLFCRDRKCLSVGEGYGRFNEDFDRKHWQHLVHNDATQFLKLCEELQIVPDLWGLYEWSNWITPTSFKKRFDTAFYLVVLKDMPHIIMESNEVNDFAWKTPLDFLQSHFREEIWLPPPQFYELSRLFNFSKLEDVKNYAQSRFSEDIEAILPVETRCKDGHVSIMPGDDMYARDPNAAPGIATIDKTVKDFRAGAKNIHRFEFYTTHDIVLRLNIKLKSGHVAPLNVNPNKHD